MPAPVKHGVKRFISTGELPPGCGHVERKLSQFKSVLVAEVELVHGTVSLVHGAAIQTAVRFETVALLLHRWLRTSIAELTPAERRAHVMDIAKASKERDAALKELGLSRDVRKDSIDALFSKPSAGEVDA